MALYAMNMKTYHICIISATSQMLLYFTLALRVIGCDKTYEN